MKKTVQAATVLILLSGLIACGNDESSPRSGGSANDMNITSRVRLNLEAIRDADSRINAFITVDTKGALEAAKQLDRSDAELLLRGFTLAIKDNIEVAGLPSTAGTKSLKAFIPKKDATVVARLKAAGAVVIGKANLHELAYGITSNNYAFGAVGNAHNPDYFAGGSSGGTAVAIAAGLARAGLGTDTGGSSRIPAALNGIVGFRPTVGRYPNDGLVLISNTRDTVGPMGLNVSDVALMDAVLSNDSPGLEQIEANSLRLGVPRTYFYDDLDPQVKQAMESVLLKLAATGVTLVEADLNVAALNAKVGFPIVLYETGQLLPQYLTRNQIGLSVEKFLANIASPDVKGILTKALGGSISEASYKEALELFRPQLQQAYRDYFSRNKVDAIIFPTTPLPARLIQGSDTMVELNGKQVPTFPTYIRNVDPSSNAGIPGLSIPINPANEDSLPVGMEIESLAGQDRRLLAIGQLIETILRN